MSRTFGLVRVSDTRQAKLGHSIPQQIERIVRWGGANGVEWCQESFASKDAGDCKPPHGLFVDAGESAYRKSFRKRPACKAMMDRLRPGDQVVVTRIDRVWRSMRDFTKTMRWFEDHKIRFVCLEPEIDFSKAVGRLLAQLLVAFAEFESSIKSERLREAFAARKARRQEAGEPVDAETEKKLKKLAKRAKRGPRPMTLDRIDGDFRPPPKELIEAVPCGRVWLYLRCSHWDSVKSGLGLEAQFAAGMAEAQRIIDERPEMAFGGVFKDEAVSAYKTPFAQREKAGELAAILKPGDVVIFPRLDRGFRNTRDMLNTLPEWLERGITVKIVDQKLDFSKWTGQFILTALSMAAELEAAITSARQKDIAAWLRAHGRVGSGIRAPRFFKIVGNSRERRRVVWNRAELVQFRCIRFLRRTCGLSLMKAGDRIDQLIAKREGRKPIPMSGCVGSRRNGVVEKTKHDTRRKDRRNSVRLVYPDWQKDTICRADKIFDEALNLYRVSLRKKRARGDNVRAEFSERVAQPSGV